MTSIDQAPALREFGTALTATLVVTALWMLGWATALERPIWDVLMRLPRPGGAFDVGMAAVVIDDRSLESHGPLPWPRPLIAEVIQRIREVGADAVVVDILLTDTKEPDSDTELGRAFAAGPIAAAAVLAPDGSWILPAEGLGGADFAAHAHAEVASDGVLRMISSTKQAHGVSLPALSVAGAGFAGCKDPVRPGSLLRSDFRTPPNSILQVSATDVLTGRGEAAQLASRVVFLGVTASGAGDQFLVPVGTRNRPVPGVLVHASFASSIARGGLLSELPWWAVPIVFFVAGATMQTWRSRARSLHLSSLVAVLVVVPVMALVSLWFGNLLVPSIGVLTTAATSVFLREAFESRGARRETDEILRSLVQDASPGAEQHVPRGVQGRLRLAHLLQKRLIRDRDLRRTLLEGLREGVVLWGADGAPLLHNASTEALWGHVPTQAEVEAEGTNGGGEPNATLEVVRHGRSLEVAQRPVGTGRLALMRDVSKHRELERRRREMQRLVSHELKTPLASIAGFGEMLERYPLTGEELARTAGMIRCEAERLGLMVKRFLDLDRLGAGHWEQQRTEVDLSALVAQRCQVLAASADRSNIKIVVHTALPVVLTGVRQLLEELVDNLVGNALKYSPENSQVAVEVRCAADATILEVVDHGQGIPEEAIDHLFERFYRVPGASAPGTGLGLAFVNEVATLHGATVSVDSEVGHGSIFKVIFPRSED